MRHRAPVAQRRGVEHANGETESRGRQELEVQATVAVAAVVTGVGRGHADPDPRDSARIAVHPMAATLLPESFDQVLDVGGRDVGGVDLDRAIALPGGDAGEVRLDERRIRLWVDVVGSDDLDGCGVLEGRRRRRAGR